MYIICAMLLCLSVCLCPRIDSFCGSCCRRLVDRPEVNIRRVCMMWCVYIEERNGYDESAVLEVFFSYMTVKKELLCI